MSEPRSGAPRGAAGPHPWGPSPVVRGVPREPGRRARPPAGTGRAARAAAAEDRETPRALTEVKQLLTERARAGLSPFQGLAAEQVERVVGGLGSLDADEWAAAFSAPAEREAAVAQQAAAMDDVHGARRAHLQAYGWYRAARFPAPTSPGKQQAYQRGQEQFLAAARYFDPPLERIKMAFPARSGEGAVVPGCLRRPAGTDPLPVAVIWGGADSGKEDVAADPYLARDMATLAVDMPGVGEAPLVGSADAERLWDAVLGWIERQPDLDSERVGFVGEGFGGYWAVKLAHTHAHRVRAVVSHAGPVHYAFSADWIDRAEHGEYPFGLAESVGRAFGYDDPDDWRAAAPRFSLLQQGLLEQPCAPLLCVDGGEDTVVPIADQLLLLEHGWPKSARLFPGGHLGRGPGVTSTIADWLAWQLEA
jgi:esterase FrsA